MAPCGLEVDRDAARAAGARRGAPPPRRAARPPALKVSGIRLDERHLGVEPPEDLQRLATLAVEGVAPAEHRSAVPEIVRILHRRGRGVEVGHGALELLDRALELEVEIRLAAGLEPLARALQHAQRRAVVAEVELIGPAPVDPFDVAEARRAWRSLSGWRRRPCPGPSRPTPCRRGAPPPARHPVHGRRPGRTPWRARPSKRLAKRNEKRASTRAPAYRRPERRGGLVRLARNPERSSGRDY